MAVQDAYGSLVNEKGLDIPALLAHCSAPENLRRSVEGFTGGSNLKRDDLWKHG